jgi:hypothetical protein
MMITIRLAQEELGALPEYSCSVPTGVRIGKQWKRKINYHDVSKGWMLGEYVEIGSKTEVGISWKKIYLIEKFAVSQKINRG